MNLNQILTKVFTINYRSTILGIGVIAAAIGRISLAFRTKHFDFIALAEDGQLIMTTVGLVLSGLALMQTKDARVTGTGTQAKTVDDSGVVTNVQGDPVGKQPADPPAPKL